MKRCMRRIVSLIIAVSFIETTVFLSGCGKKTEERSVTVSELPAEITADMPWYDSTVTYVTNDVKAYEHEWVFSNIYITSEAIAFRTTGRGITDPTDFENSVFTEILQVYDLDGTHLYDMDTLEKVSEYEPDAVGIFIEDVMIEGDSLVIEARKTESGMFRYDHLYMDPLTGEITDSVPIDKNAADYDHELSRRHVDGWIIGTRVLSLPDGSAPKYFLDVGQDKDSLTPIDLSEQMNNASISAVDDFIYMGDGQLLLKVMNYQMVPYMCLVDLNELTVTDTRNSEDYSWLDDIDPFNYSYYEGIGNIAVDEDGIKILDLDTKTEDVYLSYDNCDINRFDAASLYVAQMSEDRIVLVGASYREQLGENSYAMTNPDTMIVVLNKADTNPNAGKNVLGAANLEYLTYPLAEAICEFNRTSGSAFIMMDPRYDYDVISKSVIFDAETDRETYDLQVQAAIMSQLSVDLLAGEGPDIILGAMDYRQLDNPDIFLDLSSNVGDPSVYENVMEFAKTDGALYQVPLAFGMEGLLVKNGDVDSEAAGFTYDSYGDFVSGPCNGADPSGMTRLSFMCMCLAEMSSTFQQDGGYNYNNDDFAALADFVNGRILPDEIEPESLPLQYTGMDQYKVGYAEITSPLELISLTRGQIEEQKVMGFPSAEGKGLLIDVFQSVAISAATEAEAECRSFVEMLVGSDMQLLFAKYSGISINRNAQASVCEPFASANNLWYEALCAQYTPDTLQYYGYPMSEVDPELLRDQIDGYIENAAGIRMTDAAVEIIVREEIQAYFAGQKSIDDVMRIIQNRVDTFVNERG